MGLFQMMLAGSFDELQRAPGIPEERRFLTRVFPSLPAGVARHLASENVGHEEGRDVPAVHPRLREGERARARERERRQVTGPSPYTPI